MFDEPIAGRHSGVSLPTAGCHLDERAGTSLRQGVLEVHDRFVLDVPESALVQLGHPPKLLPELDVELD